MGELTVFGRQSSGGIGSEPQTFLPRLPLVDRLALEMAANEDGERPTRRRWMLAPEGH